MVVGGEAYLSKLHSVGRFSGVVFGHVVRPFTPACWFRTRRAITTRLFFVRRQGAEVLGALAFNCQRRSTVDDVILEPRDVGDVGYGEDLHGVEHQLIDA